MNKLFKSVAALLTAIGLIFGLAACAPDKIEMSKVTLVVDVRTPAEYAAGHLSGAVNVDVEASDFSAKISSFDVNGIYVVYCHSGRRAGIAMDQMVKLGFKNVINAGGLDAAAAETGLAIVQ